MEGGAVTLLADGVDVLQLRAKGIPLETIADGGTTSVSAPLFPTPTKASCPATGLEDIAETEREVRSKITTFCIGGIKPENMNEILAAGARRCVVLSRLLLAEDIVAETRALRSAMSR